MAGVVTCSIVIAHRRPDTNWADEAGLRVDHPPWRDMERQLGKVDDRPRRRDG